MSATCSNSFAASDFRHRETWGRAGARTFIGKLGDRALDGESVAWLELLVHVLADHPILVFLNQQHELALLLRTRDGRIRANGQIALLIYGRTGNALGCAHDDQGRDGRERRLAVGQFKDEARRVVVVRFDRLKLEIEEALRVQRGLFLLLLGW